MNFHWGDAATNGTDDQGNLCVGIDPNWENIPTFFKSSSDSRFETLVSYTKFVVDLVHRKVAFIKPQSAFFESYGPDGVKALSILIQYAKSKDLLVILDAKRGDIGSTARAYADAYLNPSSNSGLEVDCITVNPFLGRDTLVPFVDTASQNGKGLFILVKTSNPDSGWIQGVEINSESISTRIAKYVAERARDCVGESGVSSIGAVVGATYSDELARMREIMPNSIFLTPGLGPQGGKVDALKSVKIDQKEGCIAPVSRGITLVSNVNLTESAYRDAVNENVARMQNLLADK